MTNEKEDNEKIVKVTEKLGDVFAELRAEIKNDNIMMWALLILVGTFVGFLLSDEDEQTKNAHVLTVTKALKFRIDFEYEKARNKNE